MCVVGYLLNRYNYDVRMVSVGVDYFQVLAIFANAKVAWPPQIKELFRLLSAFNLNLEIVAPECLVPDVSFAQKFSIILAVPLVIMFVFFCINGSRLLYAWVCKGQRQWRLHIQTMASSISIMLLLLFLLYLNVTRVLLSIWHCL